MGTDAGTGLFERLAAVATLGTRRVPIPKDALWPEDSLAVLDAADSSPEKRLLRAAAAGALWERAGGRAAPEPLSAAAADFPAATATPQVSEAAAWRLARMVGGEYDYLLSEWFELAAAGGRCLAPHWLPLVLERVPAAARAQASGVLGAAAAWLAARHPTWLAEAAVAEPSDLRWQEGSLPERIAELTAVRAVSLPRSRAWLRNTWETDPPEAREAFVTALLPTVQADDEEFLDMALDDKRKSVRQAAAQCLARLPESAHARRNLARLDPLLELGAEQSGLLGRLRKRKLRVDLPTAPDKTAQRDGIEAKPPASRKIGERAFWLVQMIAIVPPAHWCRRFTCDADEFLTAAFATEFAAELRDALTEAAIRNPESAWLLALTRAWLESKQDFPAMAQAVQGLVSAAAPTDRETLMETVLRDSNPENFGLAMQVLSMVDARWSAALTQLALDRLAVMIAGTTTTWSQPRNVLDAWARRCDRGAGAQRVAALLNKFPEGHSWRNALEQFNDIVAFRAAMQQELTT